MVQWTREGASAVLGLSLSADRWHNRKPAGRGHEVSLTAPHAQRVPSRRSLSPFWKHSRRERELSPFRNFLIFVPEGGHSMAFLLTGELAQKNRRGRSFIIPQFLFFASEGFVRFVGHSAAEDLRNIIIVRKYFFYNRGEISPLSILIYAVLISLCHTLSCSLRATVKEITISFPHSVECYFAFSCTSILLMNALRISGVSF